MASKLKLNEVVLQSPNGLVEKSISMGDDGVVKVNGVQVADIVSGTFTPFIFGTTTVGTATYSNQLGSYTKIGNRVFVDIYIGWSSHTGTGNIRIGGLPFNSASTVVKGTCLIQSYSVSSPANTFIIGQAFPGSSVIQVLYQVLGGGAWAEFPITVSGTFALSISYEAD